MPRKVTSEVGRKQVSRVMRMFYKGKKGLESSAGGKVTDPEQAKRIAMEEGRAAEERGVKRRAWHGRSRIRPILKRG